MSEDKEGLKFSNFNLTDNHENDNQKDNNRNNYNLISEITNVENFEFEFEPDEENEESVKKHSNLKNNVKENNVKNITIHDVEVDNTETNNIKRDSREINSELKNKSLVENNAKIKNEFDNEIIKNSNNDIDTKIITANEFKDNINTEISEDEAEDILAQVLAQDYTTPIKGFEEFAERKKIREEAAKALDGDNFEKIEIEYNLNETGISNQDEEEENKEDNIFYDNILEDLIEDDTDEELDFSELAGLNINDDYNEESLFENKEDNKFDIEDDDELHVDYNDLDYFEEIHDPEDNEQDYNLTNEDDFNVLDFNDIDNSEETIFEDENLNLLHPAEHNNTQKLNGVDIEPDKQDEEVEFENSNLENNELDLEELMTLDDFDNDSEFDFDSLTDITEENFDNINDESFNFDQTDDKEIEKEFDLEDIGNFLEQDNDSDSGIDDEGFNLDLGSNSETNEIDDGFDLDDIEDFVEKNDEYDGSIDDEGFNIDLGSDNAEEEDIHLEDFDNITELDNNTSSNKDEDFNLDFDEEEEKSEYDEFLEYNDLEEHESGKEDNDFGLDFDDENEFDDIGDEFLFEEEPGSSIDDEYADVLSDYEKNELTAKTKQHLIKIRTVIKNVPQNTKKLTANTIAFLKRLSEIRNEIKEEGARKTFKKYLNYSKQMLSQSAAKTSKKIQTKIKAKALDTSKKSKQGLKDTKKVGLDEWTEDAAEDTWGLGPAAQGENKSGSSNLNTGNEAGEADEEDEADWDEDDISFSTADMLMEDTELGLEEFGDFSKSKKTEEEDNTDYSGILGKFRRIRKIIFKWARLIYKYFDSIIDFEKNWWKVVDFLAVVMLMVALAMVVAYYIWHK